MKNKNFKNYRGSKMRLKRSQKISAGVKVKKMRGRRKLITINVTVGEACILKRSVYFHSWLVHSFYSPHGLHIVIINDHLSIVQKHWVVYTCRSKSSQLCFQTGWGMTLMAFDIQFHNFVCLLWRNSQEEKLKEWIT